MEISKLLNYDDHEPPHPLPSKVSTPDQGPNFQSPYTYYKPVLNSSLQTLPALSAILYPVYYKPYAHQSYQPYASILNFANLTNTTGKKIKKHFCMVKGCNRAFPSMSLLERHVRVHTGAKPFSCSVCGKFFNRKDNRDSHMNIHAKERR